MRLVVTPTLLAQNRRPVLALRQINGTDNLQKILITFNQPYLSIYPLGVW